MNTTLQQFVSRFPDMSEDEAMKYLTDHLNELPEEVQELVGTLALSRALDNEMGKFQLKSGLLAVLEAIEVAERPEYKD